MTKLRNNWALEHAHYVLALNHNKLDLPRISYAFVACHKLSQILERIEQLSRDVQELKERIK
ncbi:MAG: hypothetical protein ABL888_16520 [Pirellulaceae bacterium]